LTSTVRKEKKMSDEMSLDGGMVCTGDDPSPFGTDETGMWELPEVEGIGPGPDETGIWELPDEGGICPGPDETGIWEVPDLQTPGVEPEPSVIIDWESEPTIPDAEAPIFPEVEAGEVGVEAVEAGEVGVEAVEAGEIAVEAAEGLELLEVLEIGALFLL
jgi:hypothetical protein